MLHLKSLGISVPEAPSEFMAAAAAVPGAALEVAKGIGNTVLDAGKTVLDAGRSIAGSANVIVIVGLAAVALVAGVNFFRRR